MAEFSRVAVRGIGIIAPGAIRVEPLRRMLESNQTGITEITQFDTQGLAAKRAGMIANFNPREFIAPAKMRRMSRLSRFAVSGARLAFEDMGTDGAGVESSRVGVALGTAFGPVQISVDYMNEYVEKGASLAPPQLFAESVANAPGSHIGIEFGLTGFNITFTQRESSALGAVSYAASQIAKGVVDAALAGGVEDLSEMVFSALDRIGALAHAAGNLDERCRPFDRRRNGLVAGEGTGLFYLSRSGDPDEPVYGYLSGFGFARDTSASISDWGSGAGHVERAMRMALDDAGIHTGDVDAIWASANGSVKGDGVEYLAIQNLFRGETTPPVVATKGYFGEYAAAGAVHLASALLAIRDQAVPCSAGFEEGEEAMTLDIVRERRSLPMKHILLNSLSAGGGVVSVVISRDADE